jgi:hypothetical protein
MLLLYAELGIAKHFGACAVAVTARPMLAPWIGPIANAFTPLRFQLRAPQSACPDAGDRGCLLAWLRKGSVSAWPRPRMTRS